MPFQSGGDSELSLKQLNRPSFGENVIYDSEVCLCVGEDEEIYGTSKTAT